MNEPASIPPMATALSPDLMGTASHDEVSGQSCSASLANIPSLQITPNRKCT
jgi:hypothetical protein